MEQQDKQEELIQELLQFYQTYRVPLYAKVCAGAGHPPPRCARRHRGGGGAGGGGGRPCAVHRMGPRPLAVRPLSAVSCPAAVVWRRACARVSVATAPHVTRLRGTPQQKLPHSATPDGESTTISARSPPLLCKQVLPASHTPRRHQQRQARVCSLPRRAAGRLGLAVYPQL